MVHVEDGENAGPCLNEPEERERPPRLRLCLTHLEIELLKSRHAPNTVLTDLN